MGDVSIIGLDIAKNSFQAHGADASWRGSLSQRSSAEDGCCPFSRPNRPAWWRWRRVAGRIIGGRESWPRLGHTVRLIPPAYVKPFVKRQKNDAADAEAICECRAAAEHAVFTPVKDEEQQASGVVFPRARPAGAPADPDHQRPCGAIWPEYGHAAAKGVPHVARLIERIEDPDTALPQAARSVLRVLVTTLHSLNEQIGVLDTEIARRAKVDPLARRLMTIPGVGPVVATAIVALAPDPRTFKAGRHFAAWVGLTPRQKSTGGKQRLGAISRMGERTLRRLLTIGASAVVKQALLRGAGQGSWLAQMLARKPRDAGHRRPGQQDRPNRLGADGQRRRLSSSGRGGLRPVAPARASRRRRSEGTYGATVGETGSGKPELSTALQARSGDLDPIRELPYRPAANHRRITGRTDGSIRLRVQTIPKLHLR